MEVSFCCFVKGNGLFFVFFFLVGGNGLLLGLFFSLGKVKESGLLDIYYLSNQNEGSQYPLLTCLSRKEVRAPSLCFIKKGA